MLVCENVSALKSILCKQNKKQNKHYRIKFNKFLYFRLKNTDVCRVYSRVDNSCGNMAGNIFTSVSFLATAIYTVFCMKTLPPSVLFIYF